eukprot:TRINITY_DN5471_c0_g1_i1.p1 TRINITY_DN5471_c0_g1~~TRINITY_DN5471_c0_g1_i1.p1  ORF type:complete len:427 (+),score=67.14 TRINITY_DN5471_c0_g1_i1:192-1472(+)
MTDAVSTEVEQQDGSPTATGDSPRLAAVLPARPSAEERCRASMVLGAVGDAMGYNKGAWEFCASTSKILLDLQSMTSGKGILALDCSSWMVSDDTVEHLATAEGLVRGIASDSFEDAPLNAMMCSIAKETKRAGNDFTARAPGKTEQRGIKLIEEDGRNWEAKPFDSGAVGCGAAMRAPCIGLVFRNAQDMQALIMVAVETCRLTKTHPTGFLGGVCAAAFTSFAMQGMPIALWGPRFVSDVIGQTYAFVAQPGKRHVRENEAAFREGAFERKWRWYIHERGLSDEAALVPNFPASFGTAERDSFYAECAKMPGVNPSGKNPGSKGYDSVLIAYDALLWVETQMSAETSDQDRWAELCYRAVLHRGDNDSTGSIAAAWYGALHGFNGVPPCHLGVEYRGRCDAAGRGLERSYQQAVKHFNTSVPTH